MSIFRPGRLRTVLSATAALILICTFYLYWTPPPASTIPSTVFEVPLTERQIAFWKVLRSILDAHAPNCPSPTLQASVSAVHFNATTVDPRPDLIVFGENDLDVLTEAHANYLNDIRTAQKLRPAHSPGTRGIVTTAGGSYLPVFLSSLRMLRRTGSTLPVEVYMKDASEYEKKICDKVLPDMGARCLILSDVVGKDVIQHYQLKVFAVLFSSFEEIVWMDADCFPMDKPEILLNHEPFTSTGLVTWPDFWASSVSPAYYNISQQPMPPMTERQSSETGIFLVSKKTHYLTLLLAAYYNYYGPSHYFRLLSQGAPGEGDKETFLQAATAWVNLSTRWRVQDPSVDKPPRVFFIHANYPKFNPAENVFGYNWETTPTLRPDGTEGRAWTAPEDVLRRFGIDIERAYWEEIKWVSCSPDIEFRTWEGKTGVCEKVESYWNTVFAEPHDDDPKFVDEG
ncbi:hypothetical protein ABOM_002940 [Aspergillus bombycis]|uniref:Alpha-1,2-mannosyltransferase n=1 Tax=Aspergillus bombycis TaxID=109264 RepID=A0A1F8AAL5_9EURO|nr:hypothetical protein ABOM_002940 [Aspergillus bombycis]OGM48764.1 hypothetical protein ABOM_002940 [Aspergillus bombycis]